jgi:undecaprenyl-diphosphatase
MTQRRLLTLLGASALAVMVIALTYSSAPLVALDNAAQSFARLFVSPVLTRPVKAVTMLGGTIGGLACAALAGAVMLARRRWRALIGLGVVVIGIRAMIFGLKPLVLRDRPLGGVIVETGHSYPSGHAIAGAALWVYLAWLASGEIRAPRARAAAVALLLLTGLVIGLTRLYLGVHWLTDVVGGLAAGTVVACAAILLVTALETHGN